MEVSLLEMWNHMGAFAKIIAFGRTREEALGRLRRAVAQTTVIIEGGATNKSFLLDLLDQPEVELALAALRWGIPGTFLNATIRTFSIGLGKTRMPKLRDMGGTPG